MYLNDLCVPITETLKSGDCHYIWKTCFFQHLTDCSWYNIHLRILQFWIKKRMREVGGGKGGPGSWHYKNMPQNIEEYTYSSLCESSFDKIGWILDEVSELKSPNFFSECWLNLLTAKAPYTQLPICFLYWRASPSGTLKATSGETFIQRNSIQLC